MKKAFLPKKQLPFPFILEELLPVRPVVKQAFGFTHIYLDERLLCSLRDSAKQPSNQRYVVVQVNNKYLDAPEAGGWFLEVRLSHVE